MINMRCVFLISALLLNVCWCLQYSGYPWFGNYNNQYYPGMQMVFPKLQMGFPGFGNYYNQYYPGMQTGYLGMQTGYPGYQMGYPGYLNNGIGSGLGLLNQFKDEETNNPFHITGFSEGDQSSTDTAAGANNFYSVSHSSVSTVDKDGTVHKTGETVINKNGEITKFKD